LKKNHKLKKATMKRIFFTLLSTLLLSQAFAQKNCDGFGQFRKGLKMELTSYDDDNKVGSIVNQEVIDLVTKNGEVTATNRVSMADKKGKPMAETFTTQIKCKDGNIYMNFKDLLGAGAGAMQKMEGTEMKITGDDLMYPYALSVGQTFPEATTQMEMIMNGMSLMKMSFTMKNRKVTAKESLTTPAGTFECYKITYSMVSSMGMIGEMTSAMWMSDGMMIKTESYNKKGVKNGYTLLTKLTK
jgi:hypothetical protein